VLGLFGPLNRRRAERDANAAAQLYELRERARSSGRGAYVVHVLSVYQQARRGTKAFVKNDATGAVRDAWFWWSRIKPGEILLVEASSGWGPHSGRTDVLYVGGEHRGRGISQGLPSGTAKRARRHEARARAGRA
jgi:hypothetical protein